MLTMKPRRVQTVKGRMKVRYVRIRHLDGEDADDHDLPAPEGEAGDRQRRQQTDHQTDADGAQRHDQAAADRSPEVRDGQRPAEVLQGQRPRYEVRVRVDGVLGRLEGRVEHPVDGEAEADEGQQPQGVVAQLAHAGRLHSTSPIFSIWRM
jgi:hypothetical protein